eukprot:COSAG05_NODE_121_length_17719_cov_168.686266_15_plen_70_part_00
MFGLATVVGTDRYFNLLKLWSVKIKKMLQSADCLDCHHSTASHPPQHAQLQSMQALGFFLSILCHMSIP